MAAGLVARMTGLLASAAFLGTGCRDSGIGSAHPGTQATRPVAHAAPPSAVARCLGCEAPAAAPTEPPRPLRRCFPDLPPWVEAPVEVLLDRAGARLERSAPEDALACAAEAARQMPRSVEAHHDRALALLQLGRPDEARDAVTLALALAPSDLEMIELAADLYVNHLPPTAERAAVGLEYARRGRRLASARPAAPLGGRLALLEGQALVDLGRAQEALRPIAVAVQRLPEDPAPLYERGVALFELCRFDEAARSFNLALGAAPDHAHALYHLGLIREREGNDAEAAAFFAQAARHDAKSFAPVPEVSPVAFAERVRAVLAALPEDVRRDLAGLAVEPAELPATEDLTAEVPPLSPTILGLYRGLPMGRDDCQDATESASFARERQGRVPSVGVGAVTYGRTGAAKTERAIVLYRRNLLRSVRSIEALDRAIARTLLHEVGHLRGEDDGSLRDRGLE